MSRRRQNNSPRLPSIDARDRHASKSSQGKLEMSVLEFFENNGRLVSNDMLHEEFEFHPRSTMNRRVRNLRKMLATHGGYIIPRPKPDPEDSVVFWYKLTGNPEDILENSLARVKDSFNRLLGLEVDAKLIGDQSSRLGKRQKRIARELYSWGFNALGLSRAAIQMGEEEGFDVGKIAESVAAPKEEDLGTTEKSIKRSIARGDFRKRVRCIADQKAQLLLRFEDDDEP